MGVQTAIVSIRGNDLITVELLQRLLRRFDHIGVACDKW